MFRKSPGLAIAALLTGTLACATTSAQSTTSQSPREQSMQTRASGPERVNDAEPGMLPSGQELDVRLQDTLSSETSTVEQHFQATTVVDITQDGDVLVPAGSLVRGVVRAVEPATRTNRTGKLTLAFDRIEVQGRAVTIRDQKPDVRRHGVGGHRLHHDSDARGQK